MMVNGLDHWNGDYFKVNFKNDDVNPLDFGYFTFWTKPPNLQITWCMEHLGVADQDYRKKGSSSLVNSQRWDAIQTRLHLYRRTES